MTTGMSAPPIGRVMVRPRRSASAKKAVITGGVAFNPNATIAPSTSAAANRSRLKICWPEKRMLRVMRPCSLPKAIALPLKDTEPMMPPTTARVEMA